VTELRPASGRVPPHDLDAEAIVLSDILLKPDNYDVVAPIVRPEYFYAHANRAIFEAIEAVAADHDPIDAGTVAARLRTEGKLEAVGGMPYLSQIVDATPAVENVRAHAEIIRDRWVKRQLIVRCQSAAAEAFTWTQAAHPLVLNVEAALSELASLGASDALEPIGAIADREMQLIQQAQVSGQTITGIPTGFSRLDGLTGGLHATDLLIVAGRPAMGKSALAMNLAANVARPSGEMPGFGVAFFSLEMPRGQVALRFACSESGVSTAHVRHGKLTAGQMHDLIQGAQSLAAFPIWVDDTPSVSLLDLRARVRKLQRDVQAGRVNVPNRGLALVVVDYIQLMRGIRNKGDSREAEVASLSRGLKALAKELSLTVLAVAQLNRAVEKTRGGDKRPQLSDLRESGALEQDADAVYFVYRPEYYDDAAPKGEAELIIGKQRNGPCDTVEMYFKASCTRFYEKAEEDYTSYFDPSEKEAP
jgi:replicative DNA helicase